MSSGTNAITFILTLSALILPGIAKTAIGTEVTVNISTQEQALEGLSQRDALARFGPASSVDEFDLKPELPVFRIDLPGFFDEEAIRSGKTRIRELTWSYTDTHNRTLWFALNGPDWIYFHHLVWDKGMEY